MDPVTHTLTGALLGRAGLRRATPLGTATLVLAANAPDVDILTYAAGDSYFALSFRRGITHGLPAMAVLPLVVATLVIGWDRWVRRRRDPSALPVRAGPVFVLALVGLLTHPVLDWMNTYGMRWRLPFDGAWSYGDALFIVDPWLWLLLGGGVIAAGRWSRRAMGAWAVAGLLASAVVLGVPLPIRAKLAWVAGVLGVLLLRRLAGPEAGPGPARGAAAAAALYVALMVGAAFSAEEAVRRTVEADGFRVEEVMVAPEPADPFSGRVVVQTPGFYLMGEHHWLPRRLVLAREAPVPILQVDGVLLDTARVAVRAAAADPRARHFLVWSRFPFYRVARAGDGYRVELHDARYSRREAGSLGGLTVWLDGEMRPDPGAEAGRE